MLFGTLVYDNVASLTKYIIKSIPGQVYEQYVVQINVIYPWFVEASPR